MKKQKQKQKRIGIIGGMGPDASVRFLGRLVELSRDEHGVSKNSEYPEVFLSSISVNDFVENKKFIKNGIERIVNTSLQLEELGVSCFGISCNTAHIVLEQNNISLPNSFVSMVDEVVNKIERMKFSRVGILGSPVTIQSELYQDKLKKIGIKSITPTKKNTDVLGGLIVEILGGKTKGATKKLIEIADSLVGKGAEVMVLACTELPLVFPDKYKKPIIDTSDVLVKALLNKYYLY